MAENRAALLQHYRKMREELLSAIDGLSEELMIEPSLDGWSVRDHLAHLALGMTSGPVRSREYPPATIQPGA